MSTQINSMRQQIEAAIPHRGPMLLVDEIIQRSEHEIVCRKSFRPDEFFFQGHYPENAIVPGVILCECGVQSGAILLSSALAGNAGVPVLARLSDVKFKNLVRPGDSIDIHVILEESLAGAYYFTARIEKAGRTVARFSFACTSVDPAAQSVQDKEP